MSSTIERQSPPVSELALWFSLLGGPMAWTIHLLSSYPLTRVACDMQSVAILNAITGATALLAVAAAAVGWLAYRRVRRGGNDAEESSDPSRRARFMAVSGMVLGLFFAFTIVVEGLPPLLQDPCEIGI